MRRFHELTNRPPSALLPGAHNERQAVWAVRHFRSRSFNDLEILSIIQMHPLAGRTERYVTDYASLIPFRKVRFQSVWIYIAIFHAKRRGKR